MMGGLNMDSFKSLEWEIVPNGGWIIGSRDRQTPKATETSPLNIWNVFLGYLSIYAVGKSRQNAENGDFLLEN